MKHNKRAELDFFKALKRVAETSQSIINAHVEGGDVFSVDRMMEDLRRFAETITPWARRQSEKMIEAVNKKNKSQFKAQSKEIAQRLKIELSDKNILPVARSLMDEQVALFQSIPVESGDRVARIAYEERLKRAQEKGIVNFMSGTRAEYSSEDVAELQKMLGMNERVAINRAKLIARTETTRSNSAITEARAVNLGSPGYIWRSARVRDSRESHKEMHGKFVPWDKPPTLSDGTTGHAGSFPNCLCYQEIILPEE